jgi:predicted nucleic acid-binding protein
MLVDTSVWIDHFRSANARLHERLAADQVWTHPYVVGELACGNLSPRRATLAQLAKLRHASVIHHADVLHFIAEHRLHGIGLGWVDVNLLASAYVARLPLWALDRRLAAAARHLGLETPSPRH